MIDDYTTIHSKRRPKDLKTSKENSMCNIILKYFQILKGIPRPPPQFIQNREGINAAQLTNHMCSPESMVKLSWSIVNEGGWFGTSIVFQDDAMVMLLYWRKWLLLVGKGNSKDTWRRRTHNTWRWRTTLTKSERCYLMTASLYRKYNYVQWTRKWTNNDIEQWLLRSFQTTPLY